MVKDTTNAGSAPLGRGEKVCLALFGLLIVAFGGLVVLRSAFQEPRKTDFGVYAVAGWAVRSGVDIYEVKFRWMHYCYPPPFAVLMVPFADPVPGGDPAGCLPFAVSVALWYALSIGFLALAMSALVAVALPDAARGSRRWWYACTVPVYICLAGVGQSLSRGQVNLLLIALLVGMFVAAVRGRAVAAGAWLAGAVVLKVMPAILLLYPLVRFLRPWGKREWRVGVGLALGLVVLLGALPAVVWGIEGAVRNNLRFIDAVLTPGATGQGDQTRGEVLTNGTATHSQSFLTLIHNCRYPDSEARPAVVDRSTRLAHWAIAGTLTLLTLAVGWRRLGAQPADQVVFFGCVCLLMVLVTPVSHPHYAALALPLLVGLHVKGQLDRPGQASTSGRMIAVMVGWGVLFGVILLPYPLTMALRETGLAALANLGLWAVGLAEVARRPRKPAKPQAAGPPGLPLAA